MLRSLIAIGSCCALAGWLIACDDRPITHDAGAGSPPPILDQPPPAPPPTEWLSDVSTDAGIDFVHVHGGAGQRYMVETMAAGGGFLDFDNDGWLDIYLVQSGPLPGYPNPSPQPNQLFRNRGDGTFENVTSSVGGGDIGYGMGVCFADVDNNGFTDLYVTNFGPDRLFLNQDGERLIDVTETAGIDNSHWAASCAFADYDQDGCLDLYVTNYVDFRLDNHRRCTQNGRETYCHPDVYNGVPDVLYRNRCDRDALSFEDVTTHAGVRNEDPRESKGLGVVWTDFDNDGDVDLYVANDSTRNFLFQNQGRGPEGGVTFRDVGVVSGTAFNDQGVTEAGMGTDAGDVDGDGHIDLFVAHLDLETNTLYRNQGRGLFLDSTTQASLAAPSLNRVGFGVNLFDVDNDGDLDIFVANGHIIDNIHQLNPSLTHGQHDQLFLGDGRGRFSLAGGNVGAHFERTLVSRASAVGDFDNDGDLDLLVTNNNQGAVLLRNHVGERQNALILKLQSRFGDRDAIGARVEVTTRTETQVEEIRSGSSYLAQGDLRLHFGLGQKTGVVRIKIRWPEGEDQEVSGSELAINLVNTIRQPAL